MYLIIGFLGLLSIIAPFVLNYNQDIVALWTSLIVGAVLIVTSVLEGFAADKDRWEYWVAGIAGVGAILAPFVLGFSGLAAALWTLIIVGAVTVLAAWTKLYPGRTSLR